MALINKTTGSTSAIYASDKQLKTPLSQTTKTTFAKKLASISTEASQFFNELPTDIQQKVIKESKSDQRLREFFSNK